MGGVALSQGSRRYRPGFAPPHSRCAQSKRLKREPDVAWEGCDRALAKTRRKSTDTAQKARRAGRWGRAAVYPVPHFEIGTQDLGFTVSETYVQQALSPQSFTKDR